MNKLSAEVVKMRPAIDFLHVFKSVAISYLVSLVLLVISAFLFTLSSMSELVMRTFVTLVTAASMIVAGFFAARKTKVQGWLTGALSGLTYVVILYFVGSLTLNSFILHKGAGVVLLMGFLCGAVGGIVGVNVRRKKRQ